MLDHSEATRLRRRGEMEEKREERKRQLKEDLREIVALVVNYLQLEFSDLKIINNTIERGNPYESWFEGGREEQGAYFLNLESFVGVSTGNDNEQEIVDRDQHSEIFSILRDEVAEKLREKGYVLKVGDEIRVNLNN